MPAAPRAKAASAATSAFPPVAAGEIPGARDGSLVKRYTGIRGLSDPDEVASAVAYVASEEARSVHGATLSIDGGMTAG